MAFTALTDEEERELRRLSSYYWQEALRCKEAKAYLAGSVMLGSALETLLILMVNCYSDEAEATGAVPTLGLGPRKLLDWTLADLIRVAKATRWLPSGLNLDEEWSGKRAKVGDYAEVARMIRNLAHPARYVRDHNRRRVTAKHLARQFEIVLLCQDWLADRNNASLRGRMEC